MVAHWSLIPNGDGGAGFRSSKRPSKSSTSRWARPATSSTPSIDRPRSGCATIGVRVPRSDTSFSPTPKRSTELSCSVFATTSQERFLQGHPRALGRDRFCGHRGHLPPTRSGPRTSSPSRCHQSSRPNTRDRTRRNSRENLGLDCMTIPIEDGYRELRRDARGSLWAGRARTWPKRTSRRASEATS